MQKVKFTDLGRIKYKDAWDYQTTVQQGLIKAKRDAVTAGLPIPANTLHHLLFCEHNPVYTLGKSGSIDHVLLSEEELEKQGFEFFKINRGGDITYHGPGQVVGYPIFDLEYFFRDVHRYVRMLEEVVIRTIGEFGLEGYREEGYTGVWLAAEGFKPKRKICAIGVHLSRWVSMHGFALNVNPDIQHFGHIIPCGINEADKAVTSMELELKEKVDIEGVKSTLKKHFAIVFDFEYSEK